MCNAQSAEIAVFPRAFDRFWRVIGLDRRWIARLKKLPARGIRGKNARPGMGWMPLLAEA
ncbi:hypothetical protein [Burkholderia cepacia]|uniref:hypothetical protein n=1 Tax=Burkholderia cepacia TaxID=292 RepID=UPI0016253E88|nr:hypothetical protein [Burkholderia cepacia]